MGFSKDRPHELLLIVHGVGDPAPGETISHFSRALVTTDCPLVEQKEVLWLSDEQADRPPESGRFAKTFSTHVSHLSRNDKYTTAAEIFWADLSRVRRGLFGAVWGVFQIVFGLRYVAYVAADQPGWGAWGLRALGLHSSRILHGPLLAVNFLLAILTILLVSTQALWPDSHLNGFWADILALSASIGVLLLASGLWRVSRSRIFERFWFWTFIGAFFLGVLVGARALFGVEHDHIHEQAHSELSCGLFWYCRVFFLLMALQCVWLTAVLILMGGCWFVAIWHPKTRIQSLNVAIMLPTLLVGLWSLILPMVWVSAGEALKKFVDVQRYDWLFNEAVPLLGVQCVAAMLLVGSMVFVLIRYSVWRLRNQVEHYHQGHRAPRLILNPFVKASIAFSLVLGICVSLLMSWMQLDGTPYEEVALGRFLVEANKYAISILLPLTGLLILSLKHLRPALDIVLDVVNHFYLRPANEEEFMVDDDEFDIKKVSAVTGNIEFTRRLAISSRMRRVLRCFAEKYDHRPVLTIISHSQGTLIAAEVLNSDELDWVKEKFSAINFVTMGSPIHHLYQYYFPHIYPDIDQPFWSNLRSRINRWVNIFRIDDFVGTEIPFSDSIENSIGPKCTNHAITIAGHNWYWTDRDVMRLLAMENISPIISSVFASSVCTAENANLSTTVHESSAAETSERRAA
jgi:hypothetical protein